MSILYRDTTLTKIFVGGLPYHTTDESLQKFFDQFGAIEEAVVITDRHSGKSKGYGFVTMADRVGAERACKDPNPIIDGRKANVNLAYLGAKPRLQAGELLSFPINLKTGLATAYPAQLSRITPFIQPATPAFITHTAALAPYTPIHSINISNSNNTNNSNGPVTNNNNNNCNGTVYPGSPTTPNESPNGIINYAPATFTYPQIIQPGFEQAPAGFAPFSVIGYISPSPTNGPFTPLQPHFQPIPGADPHSPTTLNMAPTFVPALHCLPPQQIMH